MIPEIKAVLRIAGHYPPAFIMPFGMTTGNQHTSDFTVGFRPTASTTRELLWNVSFPLPEEHRGTGIGEKSNDHIEGPTEEKHKQSTTQRF